MLGSARGCDGERRRIDVLIWLMRGLDGESSPMQMLMEKCSMMKDDPRRLAARRAWSGPRVREHAKIDADTGHRRARHKNAAAVKVLRSP